MWLQVNLEQAVAAEFTEDTASVAFFGALHNVRCLTKHVLLLGAANHQDAMIQAKLEVEVGPSRRRPPPAFRAV